MPASQKKALLLFVTYKGSIDEGLAKGKDVTVTDLLAVLRPL